jgi:dihydroneopterin aldolase
VKIEIKDLTFRTIIGILPYERKIPQKVVVDAVIEYDYKNRDFLDYAMLVEKIKTLMRVSKFELLEDAVLTLKRELKAEYVSIKKPDILKCVEVCVSD